MATMLGGRAEYETGIFRPFEGVSPKYLLAPLFSERKAERGGHFHPKMVVGARGCGKTYLLKSLAQSLAKDSGVEIFYLDKVALEDGLIKYDKMQWGRKPVITVVDDLHFLVKMMQVSKAVGGTVEEEGVLKILERFRNYAKETGMIQTFVSDEGPSGLAMRFEEENKRRFLGLLDECVDTSSDMQYFRVYLDKHYTSRANVVNLDNRGCVAQYRNLEVPFNVALDIFFEEIFCESELYSKNYAEALEKLKLQYGDKATEELEKRKKEFRDSTEAKDRFRLHKSLEKIISDRIEREMKEMTGRVNSSITREFGMKDVPYAMVNARRGRELFYNVSKDGFVKSDVVYFDQDGLAEKDAETPLATVRELKVVARKLGGITKEKLGVKSGMKVTTSGGIKIMYRIGELLEMRKAILNIYRDAVLGESRLRPKRGQSSAAWMMLDDDKLAQAAFIDRELRLEVP